MLAEGVEACQVAHLGSCVKAAAKRELARSNLRNGFASATLHAARPSIDAHMLKAATQQRRTRYLCVSERCDTMLTPAMNEKAIASCRGLGEGLTDLESEGALAWAACSCQPLVSFSLTLTVGPPRH